MLSAIPFVLGVVLLISLINVYTNFRRARRAPYFRIRRDSARSGWRWLLISLISAGAVVAAIVARRLQEDGSKNSEHKSAGPILIRGTEGVAVHGAILSSQPAVSRLPLRSIQAPPAPLPS